MAFASSNSGGSPSQPKSFFIFQSFLFHLRSRCISKSAPQTTSAHRDLHRAPLILESFSTPELGGFTSTFTMAELPPPGGSSQGGSHRGRGGYRGRFRRGHRHGPRRPNPSGERSQDAQPEAAMNNPEPVAAASGEAGDVVPSGRTPTGRGRGDRGRQRGGRGGRGGTGQRSIVVSHRGGRGPPPNLGPGGSSSFAPGLSASAPEFVPGQPLPSRRFVISEECCRSQH